MSVSKDLVRQAWSIHEGFRDEKFVVRPSIPILYFGNFPGYSRSEKKVITVGLNPSFREFQKLGDPTSDVEFRFREASELLKQSIMEEGFCEKYLRILDHYFEENPFRRWFNSLAPLLRGLGCGFRADAGSEGCVLHTDLCSPLATNPTWSRLGDLDRHRLLETGMDLWTKFVSTLRLEIRLLPIIYLVGK